jgi:hypothetical protein
VDYSILSIELRNILMLTFCYTMLLTGLSGLRFRLYGDLRYKAPLGAVGCRIPASWCPVLTFVPDDRIRNEATFKRWA